MNLDAIVTKDKIHLEVLLIPSIFSSLCIFLAIRTQKKAALG